MEKNVSKKQKLIDLSSVSKKLYERLCEKIKGQDEAVHYYVKSLFSGQFLPEAEGQALSNVFLLVGEPSIGKTTMGRVTAEVLGRKIFELSLDPSAAEPDGDEVGDEVDNSDEIDVLNGFVQNNPSAVLLMKDIETAAPSVVSALGRIIENGYAYDAKAKKKISYLDTIILFTTEMGQEVYCREDYHAIQPMSLIMEAFNQYLEENYHIRTFLYECFTSDHIILFKELSTNHIVDLIQEKINAFAQSIKKEYGYELTFESNVINLCLHKYAWINAKSVGPSAGPL